jgi:calcium/calmodulin-dependent protein kinase I
MWSIGIISYLLLCGFLPFDHETSEREIARRTVYNPTPYPSSIWKNISPEAKLFVDSNNIYLINIRPITKRP